MPHLQSVQLAEQQSLITQRPGETKIGQCFHFATGNDIAANLASFQGKFVVFGLPEDIGVRANGGIGGAQTAWHAFLKSFVNIQQTERLKGEEFMILGAIHFDDLSAGLENATVEQLRAATATIDAFVEPIIQEIVRHHKIPVVIGGGHNNVYPLLKGLSGAKAVPVNAINLDAHSDFRMKEGRHSGNGFRYAYEAGYLKKYAMLGLHEAYNSQNIVAELQANTDMFPLFFEDIFLRHKMAWEEAVHSALSFVKDVNFGVELDVDCIENVLSSAATPVGISTQQALQYLYQCGLCNNAAYLHLPEGVAVRGDGLQNVFTGKLLSYLVQAFCKGVLER